MKVRHPKEVYILVNAAKGSDRSILQGFLSELAPHPEFSLHICEMSAYGLKSLADAVASKLVDGLVTSELEEPQLAALLERATFPLVIIGTRAKPLPKRTHNLRIVTLDETAVAAAATRYLIALGRFAAYGYVGFREDFCQHLSRLRRRGFLDELKRAGIRGTCFRSTLPEEKSDREELGAWLESLPKPAAVLVGHDRRAAEVLDACARRDICVPKDIRVLSIDNDEFVCLRSAPTLSSLATDNEVEGREAARQLLGLLRQRKGSSERKAVFAPIRPKVVERDSTRVIAPGLALVNRALAYIAENAERNVTVDEVVTFLGVSRRLAYLRFQEFARKSIRQAIVNARLAVVKRKLASSRLSIEAISRECGFDNANGLRVLFRRATGLSMRKWRNQNTHLPCKRSS